MKSFNLSEMKKFIFVGGNLLSRVFRVVFVAHGNGSFTKTNWRLPAWAYRHCVYDLLSSSWPVFLSYSKPTFPGNNRQTTCTCVVGIVCIIAVANGNTLTHHACTQHVRLHVCASGFFFQAHNKKVFISGVASVGLYARRAPCYGKLLYTHECVCVCSSAIAVSLEHVAKQFYEPIEGFI